MLALAAVVAGLFLMHGVRMAAGDCHGANGMAMSAMTGGAAAAYATHLTAGSPVPAADGGSHANCVSTGPRPGDTALAGLVLVGLALVSPRDRRACRAPFGWSSRRRAPPPSRALPLSLGVSRT